MSTIDAEQRRLCHTLLDAIERGDLETVEQCYASDMTIWFNVTGSKSTRDENLAVLAEGYGVHRRRLYNDRVISTFDDGFVVQYTTHVVTHGGQKRALWACMVAEVHDGKIAKLFEYLDSGRFGRR